MRRLSRGKVFLFCAIAVSCALGVLLFTRIGCTATYITTKSQFVFMRLSRAVGVANHIELFACWEGHYPPTNDPYVLDFSRRLVNVVYRYPAEVCKEAPFDLIWCGLNRKFEGGGGDDLCLTDFAVREIAKMDDGRRCYRWKRKPNLRELIRQWFKQWGLPPGT